MGCDIHLVLEQHVGEKWIAIDTFMSHHRLYAKPDDIMDGFSSPTARSRNYKRFAKLAGVRGPGPQPKGMPGDASETAKFLVNDWDEDGHSHSWLPIAEAARIFLETEWHDPAKSLSEMITKYPVSHYFNVDTSGSKNDEDFRIIFWFDN